MSFPAFMVVPLDGEPDLPWDFFVLQAARGAVAVPHWVLLAVPRTVADRLDIPVDEVGEAELERAIAGMPPSPEFLLEELLRRAGIGMPDKKAKPRLAAGTGLGSFREPVPMPELLHDVVLMFRESYSPEAFFAWMDQLEEPAWDARCAIAAMIFLLLIRAS